MKVLSPHLRWHLLAVFWLVSLELHYVDTPQSQGFALVISSPLSPSLLEIMCQPIIWGGKHSLCDTWFADPRPFVLVEPCELAGPSSFTAVGTVSNSKEGDWCECVACGMLLPWVSVAVIKYQDWSKLGKKGLVSSHNFTLHHWGKPGQELEGGN